MTLRGMLKIIVLKALDESPKNGYALMKYIEEASGHKPSTGSVYPLLESLKEKKLVSAKKKGRSKEYTLTAKGKKTLKEVQAMRKKCMRDFSEKMHVISKLTGEKIGKELKMIKKIHESEVPLKELNPELHDLKMEIFKQYQLGKIKKNSAKIKKVLGRAASEMKKL